MKKYNKTSSNILAVGLVSLFALSILSGCGGGGGSENSAKSPESAQTPPLQESTAAPTTTPPTTSTTTPPTTTPPVTTPPVTTPPVTTPPVTTPPVTTPPVTPPPVTPPIVLTSSSCDNTTQIVALTPTAGVARVGSVYSSTLYDPTISTNNTTINPQKIKIQVLRGANPVAGCSVSWQAQNGTGGGWIYADAAVTSADGTLSAWWIAGTDANQTTVVKVNHPDGSAASAQITGQATPHVTRSNSIHVWYSAPKWDNFKVTVTPRTWAPTTYYAAVNWAAAYTGIQYTGIKNGVITGQVLFSVWAVNGVNPTIISQASSATCGSFGGEGTGLHCSIPIAPQTNVPYVFEVQTALNPDGVSENYTVLFTDPIAQTTTAIATMSYPAKPSQSGGMSFVEDWAESLSSCLANTERTTDFSAQYHVPGTAASLWSSVTKASGDAVWTPNHNEVCENYQYRVVNGAFELSSGGMAAGQPLNLPKGPGSVPLQIPAP